VVYGASLLKVFWPYLTYDTVFDNRRVTSELGVTPAPFTQYAEGLYRFSTENDYRYPFAPWPEGATVGAPASARRGA
jgi:hypothetical protein